MILPTKAFLLPQGSLIADYVYMLATFGIDRGKLRYFASCMFKKIKTALLLLSLCLALNGFSQNVHGHWFGIGTMGMVPSYNSYLSELILRQKGKAVSGFFLYYFKDSLVKAPVSGSFDEQSHRLRINPFPIIYYLSPTARNSIDCFVAGNFVLTASKTESILSGSLASDANHRYTVPEISFRLKRSDDTAALVMKDEPDDEPAPVKKTDTTVALSPQSETIEAFTKREKIFTKELDIVNSTLKLELYDNGEIDYDSVSLFLNNKLILPKTKLDHRAIKLTIELDPALEYNELSMFAENLGRIPPNTAALIVYDGKMRYETLLSSDLSKSASLKLRTKR
ncbi:MAG: hypothetical protein JWQ78_322 [Sediminibacterium sp.]|nr:hypothetical protein [Sediminibacterium sp.]